MDIRNSRTNVNYTPGRGVYIGGVYTAVQVSGIVLHTEAGYENGTVSWFRNPISQVSSNYGIALDGTIDRIVDEGNTAWTNGNFDSNARTITIEFEDDNNPQNVVRTPQQYASAAWLVSDISRRYKLAINRNVIKKHNEIPPYTHPECPGNLDVDQIVRESAAVLSLANAVLPAPPADVLGEYHDWTGQVKVVNAVLQVRTQPTVNSVGNQANTPDGVLHAGMVASVVGWGVGEDPYRDGRNKWFKSFRGKWFWAGGTDQPNPTYGEVIATPEPVVVPEPVVPVVIPEPVVVPEPVVEPVTLTPGLELFDQGLADVVAPGGSEIVDMNTGKAIATFPAGRKLTVIGAINKNGTNYLQTENQAHNNQDQGLPASDFEVYIPKTNMDGITPPARPVHAPVVAPTLEQALSETSNKLVRFLLRLFHHTNK